MVAAFRADGLPVKFEVVDHPTGPSARNVQKNGTVASPARSSVPFGTLRRNIEYEVSVQPPQAHEDKSVEEIYEALVLEDIRSAADLLRPIHDATRGADGYVSLEVSPVLAHDTQGTIAEGSSRRWGVPTL